MLKLPHVLHVQAAMVLASDIHGDPIVGRQNSMTVGPAQHTGVNKNTSWLNSTGAWAFYAGLVIFGWLFLSLFMDGGFAWTWMHLIHGIITFYVLHWMKVGIEDLSGILSFQHGGNAVVHLINSRAFTQFSELAAGAAPHVLQLLARVCPAAVCNAMQCM